MLWLVCLILIGVHSVLPWERPGEMADYSDFETTVLDKLTKNAEDVATIAERLNFLDSQVQELRASVRRSKHLALELAILKTKLRCLQSEIRETRIHSRSDLSAKTNSSASKAEGANVSRTEGAATFIRWGRSSCPPGNNVVYTGFAGGNDYTNRAGPANMLCLSDQPIYANHTLETDHWRSRVYGTEYETNEQPAFDTYQNRDMPCVVCQSRRKQSSVMVPGRNKCFPGWSLEYWGYLMGPHHSHSSSQYICVDTDAEGFARSQANQDGNILYMVESMCGSLQCPPYKNGWELTCAVCTR